MSGDRSSGAERDEALLALMGRTCACPTCGQPTDVPPLDDLMVAVSPQMARILVAVTYQPGITAKGIVELLWAHDPDGGPLSAINVIHTTISQNRRRLASLGWRIVGRGSPASYTLMPMAHGDPA